MPIFLQFHLRRLLHLLRRAWDSLQAKGWHATLQRAGSNSTGEPRDASPMAQGKPRQPASDWGHRPWVLVVDGTVPAPDRDSGSLRLRNLMRALVSAGYRVAFVPDEGGTASANAAQLRACGIHVPRLRGSRDAAAWVHQHGRTLSSAILCRHHAAGHWLPFVRAVAPQASIVFDTVDLHFLREEREAELHHDRRLQRRAQSTRQRELGLIERADTTWVVSPIERGLLLELRPGADVRVVSNIIDEDTPGLSFEQRRDLLFVGGLRHPPNRDAVEWLARDIFPHIREALPGVQLHLVGSTGSVPASTVSPEPGVRLHGHVPDIAPYLDGCRLALAPLRFGAGVKGKINLSLAHGQPVVATDCAIEGMHLEHGNDVLVARDAVAFAAEVVRLYRDAALWQRLSLNGRANVRRHFSPAAALGVAKATLGPPRDA
ncbi:glycosyltransferase [Lysobacter sp. F6437]|uniref:glycosyltransferase n=1 Tax=Lysobacter sp. F6437 TaxID=3459296 RepID=UPI00403DBCF0